MTAALVTLQLALLAGWCALIACGVWILVDEARRARARHLDRHVDEAIGLTRPIGPEDDPRWGQR